MYPATNSLVRDGYPAELQNLKIGWNFRPTAVDGYSIQAISLSVDRFTIRIYDPLRMDFPSLKNLPSGWEIHPIIAWSHMSAEQQQTKAHKEIVLLPEIVWLKGDAH